jgi:hypothetical protein
MNDKFWDEQRSSLDYTLSLGYAVNKFDVGLNSCKMFYGLGASRKYYEILSIPDLWPFFIRLNDEPGFLRVA